MNGVNIIKTTRTVGFMKLRAGLIFTVTDNCLIFLLSICIILSLAMYHALSLLLDNQTKIIITKKSKVNT